MLFGIVTLLRFVQLKNMFPGISIQPSGIVKLVRPLQPTKTESAQVTPSGIVILARHVQPQKACVPIEVTVFGIEILFRL